MLITDDQIQQYRTEGYFILESVIPDATLEALRNECQRFIDERDREMEAKGVTSMGITHYKKRYFISNQWRRSPAIIEFLFSDLMAAIGRATLGDNVYLFNEQYVVKAAEVGTQFAWHQDSGYIGHYHRPYLSCWCALDDMTVENGTIYVLPYSRAGMQPDDLFDHLVQEGTNDKVGYHGDDPGIPALVPAGSIVVFSSRTFHRSGQNTTSRMRRSYLAQYSAEPIMDKTGEKYWNQAVPVVVNGHKVQPENV
ncbi:MAG TPA: phytanoyl-CoA dioxygenase family protein [Spirillospora sp.]|nr:phytanoyl-CoA dioxygenase family protein [Spirillospora sp.]